MKYIITIAIICILSFIAYFLLKEQPCEPPKRVNIIPVNAIWRGGCDGGNWIEMVENYGNGKYRFRIYNDNTGEVELDADFLASDGKCNVFKDKDVLFEIKGFINDIMFLKEGLCDMKPVYPAYGGSSWEIIKDKRNIDR